MKMVKDWNVNDVFATMQTRIISAVQQGCTYFTQLLEKENIVTRAIYNSIQAPGLCPYEQASIIVDQARRKLEDFPEYFEKFVACLEEFDRDLADEVDRFYKGELLRYVRTLTPITI